MRRFILFLLALLIAVWAGVKISIDPGYMLIAYQQWTIEMPLWFAIITGILIFVLLYFCFRFVQAIGILPERLKNWSVQRHNRHAVQLTNQGVLALAAGEWRVAEKKLLRADVHNELRWLNYIMAAQAAQELGAPDRRDNYLQQALRISPKTEVAVGLCQAHYQLKQRQFEQAQATLRRLLQVAPRQKYLIELLAQVYIELRAWDELLELITLAQKYKTLDANEIVLLQQKTYQGLLAKAAQQTSHVQVLQSIWQQLPRHLQSNPQLIHDYVKYLQTKSANNEAEEVLRKYLQKNWDPNLVYDYGVIISTHVDKQLATAESWLKHHEQDPQLLLTLGRLCLQNQLWGKARSYLETSLLQKPVPETFLVLAKLFEQRNEVPLAYENYKKGLLTICHAD